VQVRVLFPALHHNFFKIMNELKEKLTGLGLSEEMTDKAIATVAEFVKSKIPESYHSMIDDVLAGKTPEMGGILGSIGGLFGGK
jgi:ketopantoate reductase